MLGQGQERSSRDLNLKRRAELVVDVLTATHAISTLTHRQRIVEQPHMSADSRVGASRGSDRDRIDSRLRSWSRFLVTAVAIVGSAYNGTTQAADDPSKELGCGDTYTEALAIGRIANNAWNRQAAGDYPSRQCIRLRSTPNGQQYGWSWDWPTQSDTLLSFPQVIFGWKPWDGGKSSHPQLPMRIAEVGRLELSYEIETRASGKHNLATTLWLTRTGSIGAEPNPKDINTDLMIWTDGFDFDPFGTQVGRASIDGLDFEVWFASELSTPDADGPRWSYVAYRAT